jgi:hypothetical protein
MGHLVYPITITVVVEDIATTMATYDQIQVHRSTNGEAGTYVEITDAQTRPVLAAGQTVYDYIDEDGSPVYWYKFRYYDSGTPADGAFSTPAIGEKDSALDILSVEDLKTNYLFGLDLTDDNGTAYPDSLFAFFIKNAVSWLEHKLDIKLKRTDYTEERHDFYRDDYESYIFIDLLHTPVISVQEATLVLPGENTVMTFDQDWIHVQRMSGQIQMVPGVGSAGSILLGAGGSWLPFIYGANRFIPDAFRVTYTAGFGRRTISTAVSPADPDLDTIPDILVELVGKIASFGPLNIAGDLLGGAGIASQSVGLDGLNTSFATTSSATNAGYGARILAYQREIKDQVPTLMRYYKGARLVVA